MKKTKKNNKKAIDCFFVYDRFITSERARQSDEDRWLEAFHNYRGQYYKNVQFREHEKSRVLKVTKTKVLAAYGQLVDVLFSANKFPISVEETKVPEGASEYAHLNPVGENYRTLDQVLKAVQTNHNHQCQSKCLWLDLKVMVERVTKGCNIYWTC